MTTFAPRKCPATIKFGSWLRLYDTHTLLQQLKQFGLTERGLTILLKNLRVPILHVGRKKFVDGFTFFLAMRAMLSLGQSDFYAPASHPVNLGLVSSSKLRSLTRRDTQLLIAELLYAKRFNGITLTDAEIRSAATAAVDKFQAATLRLAVSKAITDRDERGQHILRTVHRGEDDTSLLSPPPDLEGEFPKAARSSPRTAQWEVGVGPPGED